VLQALRVAEDFNRFTVHNQLDIVSFGNIEGTLFFAQRPKTVDVFKTNGWTAGTGNNAMFILAADLSQHLPGAHNVWTFALKPSTDEGTPTVYRQFVAVVDAAPPPDAPRHFRHVAGDVIVFMIHPDTHRLSRVPHAFISPVCSVLEKHGPFGAGGVGVRCWVRPDGNNLLLVDYFS
jgi:hypothetical protein